MRERCEIEPNSSGSMRHEVQEVDKVAEEFEMLSVGGGIREERGGGEEGVGRGGEEGGLRERRLVINVYGEEIKEYEDIEILRGCDGMSEFPKEDLYDYNSQDEDGSGALSDDDIEMPTLEELVVGEETSGDEDIVLDEEVEMFEIDT